MGNKEYELLNEYVNSRTKVTLKHICGHEYQVRPSKFIEGQRCPKCKKRKCLTHNEFLKEVEVMGKGQYEALSTYKNSFTHVQMKHIVCGHIYSVIPNAFKQGKRCPKCSKNHVKSHETFLLEVQRVAGGEYRLLSEYKRAKLPVKMRHESCGHEYHVVAHEFLRGNRCPKCFYKNKKSPESFAKEVEVEKEYALLTPYERSTKLVKMKHLTCGTTYDVLPRNFSRGNRCPRCKISQGERMVEKTLKKHHLSFTPQIRFEDCRNIYPLPFDFGILNKHGEVIFLIEYDGEQHYEENDFYGGRESYLQRVRNDRIKSNYAKDKGIPLLRIRYDQKNPVLFLEQVLKKHFSVMMLSSTVVS